MTDFSAVSIPQPLNWQDFERNCRVLFACILNDPNTQLNGRQGQPQHGVDIWGRRGGEGTRWVGIQCKGKNADYPSAVSETELRAEVAKARKFQPPISEFILATTAPDDAKIQEVARTITQENEKAGKPMSVSVWGWGTIQAEIIRYSDALKSFHPDVTPFTDRILSDIEEIKTVSEATQGVLLKIATQLQPVSSIRSDDSTKEIEAVDQHLHAEIDAYRDLIKEGRPRTAMGLLEKLKNRCWEKASPRVRFRIKTNIGAAKLQLGDEKGAAIEFLAAREHDPIDKTGMANEVLANMLLGREDEAIAVGKAALMQDITNQDAASYLIQAHIDDVSVADPLSLVPAGLRDTAVVRAAAILFLRKRNMKEWRTAAMDAVNLFPDRGELKRFAAEAQLAVILEAKWFLLGESSPHQDGIENLRESAETLQSIWDSTKHTESPLLDTALPHNIAIAWRALGKYDRAATVLDEAIEKKPDTADFVTLRAAVHIVMNEDDEALKLLQQKGGEDNTALIMTAEALLKKDPASARKALSKVRATDDEELQVSCSVLTVETYLTEKRTEDARTELDALIKKYPEKVEPVIALFRLKENGDEASADETLTRAKNLLKPEAAFHDRFIVADALGRKGRYDEVVEVLDGKVDYFRDTPALQIFLLSLINSDRRKQAHEVLKALPDAVSNLPFYLRMKTILHVIRGDYKGAEQAVASYVGLCPEDLAMRLRWIDLLLRTNRQDEVKLFLEGQVESLKGNASDRMHLALFLEYFGFADRALKLAYEVFLKNRKDPQVHLQYVGLLLNPGRQDDDSLEMTHVSVDSVFVMESIRGERDTFLIEAKDSHHIDERYIDPDHSLAKKVMGLKPGDSFTIEEAGQPIEWRIISVKHKYIEALHSSMDRFERQFPTERGLSKIVVDKAIGPDSLESIFRLVKQRHDSIERGLQQYERTPVPLECLIHGFGGDAIQVFHGIISSGRKFPVSIGTIEERQAALNAIIQNEERGCVVDTVTFYIMRRFKIEETVARVCGKIGITETSVDVLRSRREELHSRIGKPSMSVYWQDGQYYRQEVTDEQLQAAVAELDDDLAFIADHCPIVPAEGARDLSPELRKIADKMDRGFFDTVLAAQGSGTLLLTDDRAYRMLTRREVEGRTSWLQPVLMIGVDRNLMSMEDYCNAVTRMIETGMTFISIDANVLLAAARDESDEEGQRFSKIVSVLGGPQADMASHILVAANFLREIWKYDFPPTRYKAMTGKTLECLMRGRLSMFHKIAEALLFRVVEPHRGFSNYLYRWLEGHFLLRFWVNRDALQN
jgi:tetratricopeptide (TPR) repeat protein